MRIKKSYQGENHISLSPKNSNGKELTKDQKIEALKKALLLYMKHCYNGDEYWGLCAIVRYCIGDFLEDFIAAYKFPITAHIPEFKRPKTGSQYVLYWWKLTDTKSRIEYLQNLIEQIKKS